MREKEGGSVGMGVGVCERGRASERERERASEQEREREIKAKNISQCFQNLFYTKQGSDELAQKNCKSCLMNNPSTQIKT